MSRYLTWIIFALLGFFFLINARNVPAGKEHLGRVMKICAIVLIVIGVGMMVVTAFVER
jgi:hypothetical protein